MFLNNEAHLVSFQLQVCFSVPHTDLWPCEDKDNHFSFHLATFQICICFTFAIVICLSCHLTLHLLLLSLERTETIKTSKNNVAFTTSSICFWRYDSNNSTMHLLIYLFVHQQLSLNKLWHDWMIWSASMVHPNPHLSVTWSCIIHEGSFQGLTESSKQTWRGTDSLVPSFLSFTLYSFALYHLPLWFRFSLVPLFYSTCVPPPLSSSSHCVLFAAFWTFTVSPLKERLRFLFCLRGLYLAALEWSSPGQEYLALCFWPT